MYFVILLAFFQSRPFPRASSVLLPPLGVPNMRKWEVPPVYLRKRFLSPRRMRAGT